MNKYRYNTKQNTAISISTTPGALEKKGEKFYKANFFRILHEYHLKEHTKTPRKSKWGFLQNSTYSTFLNSKIKYKMISYKIYAYIISNLR